MAWYLHPISPLSVVSTQANKSKNKKRQFDYNDSRGTSLLLGNEHGSLVGRCWGRQVLAFERDEKRSWGVGRW
jgi:hypothetical protein